MTSRSENRAPNRTRPSISRRAESSPLDLDMYANAKSYLPPHDFDAVRCRQGREAVGTVGNMAVKVPPARRRAVGASGKDGGRSVKACGPSGWTSGASRGGGGRSA